MNLSAPVYRLKRRAKLLSREEGIPLHQALDRVATAEGFSSWSLLAAQLPTFAPPSGLASRLAPGRLVIVGARPGQGKTRLCLALAADLVESGRSAYFFTFEYTPEEVGNLLKEIGRDSVASHASFHPDCSEDICAEHIQSSLAAAPTGALAVVDYLQLLDQDRRRPELDEQIRSLRSFARDRQLTIVFISQIARSFETSGRPHPGPEDVRRPNPFDMSLFDDAWFLNRGKLQHSPPVKAG